MGNVACGGMLSVTCNVIACCSSRVVLLHALFICSALFVTSSLPGDALQNRECRLRGILSVTCNVIACCSSRDVLPHALFIGSALLVTSSLPKDALHPWYRVFEEHDQRYL